MVAQQFCNPMEMNGDSYGNLKYSKKNKILNSVLFFGNRPSPNVNVELKFDSVAEI